MNRQDRVVRLADRRGLMYVCVAAAALTAIPRKVAARETQLLYGHQFTVIKKEGEFVHGRTSDGYEGYIHSHLLVDKLLVPTHRVNAVEVRVFSDSDHKSAPLKERLSFGSLVHEHHTVGEFSRIDNFGWVYTDQLTRIQSYETNFLEVLLRFVGQPYLWGSNSEEGYDCSGLVQVALHACGVPCPRNTSDMQKMVGEHVCEGYDPSQTQSGDLIFWRGHVAVLLDAEHIIHSARSMRGVVIQSLAEARQERTGNGTGDITCVRRVKISEETSSVRFLNARM